MTLVTLHIVAGVGALAAGLLAIVSRKGGPVHRVSGRVFVWSMISMTVLAVPLALEKQSRISLLNATLAFYLVLSSYATVSTRIKQSTLAQWIVTSIGIGIASFAITLAIGAARGVGGETERLPAAVWFGYAAISVVASVGDLRVLVFGPLAGTALLRRHLWRMELSLAIACVAFFIGQSKFLPETLRITPLLASPILLVLAHMMYWMFASSRRHKTQSASLRSR